VPADADYQAIGAEQSALEDKINAVGAWDIERNVEIAMAALRCRPDDASVASLSGGEKRRVALCRLLLQHPDLLSLDSRPTTGRRVGAVAGAAPGRILGQYVLHNSTYRKLLDGSRRAPLPAGALPARAPDSSHDARHRFARLSSAPRCRQWKRFGVH
jgi:hypothetical protein